MTNFDAMGKQTVTGKTVRVRSNKESIEGIVNTVIGQLRWYFEDSFVGGKFETYLNDRFDTMERDRSITPESIITNFVQRQDSLSDELEIARQRIVESINISLYFCFHANKAYSAGKVEKAWFFVTEATKWQGLACGSEHAFVVRRNTARSLAAAGGRGRSDSYEPLRRFSLQAVKEKNYPSRRNAALSIKPAVLSLAMKLRIPLSEQQAEKTITAG